MVSAFIRTGFEVFVLNKIRNYFLTRELSSCLNRYQKHLPPELRSRIKSYTRIATLPNLWFSVLRGCRLSEDERLANRYLGASTPVFDDLVDNEGYTYDEVMEVIKDDKQVDNESLVLLKYLYDNITAKINDPGLFNKYLQETARAQMISTRQKDNSNITAGEIRNITYDKGGYAALLYRSVLSNNLLPGEEEAVYHLGALLQLMNDIFDIHDDYKNEQQTLATASNDIKLLHSEYKGLIDKTLKLLRSLSYPRENIESSLSMIIAVISRGCVCLERLLALQGNNDVFHLRYYTRRDLLCDMEKIPNIRRSLTLSMEIKKK